MLSVGYFIFRKKTLTTISLMGALSRESFKLMKSLLRFSVAFVSIAKMTFFPSSIFQIKSGIILVT